MYRTPDQTRRDLLRWCTCAAAASALLAVGANAQPEPDAPRPLTLDEAVAFARTGVPAVVAARGGVDREERALAADRLADFPEVELTFGLAGRRGLGFDETAGRLVNELNWSLGAGVSASYPISDLVARPAARRRGRLLVTAAQLREARAEDEAAQETTALYVEWLEADARLHLLDFNLRTARLLFALAGDLVEAGVRPASDLAVQLAEVQRAQLARIDGRRAVAVAEARIEAFLGLDPTVRRRPVALDLAAVRPLGPLDVYLAEVLNRADLRAGRTALEAAEAQREVAGWAWVPSISVSFGGTSSFTSANQDVGLVDQLTSQNPSQRAGLSVSLPLLGRPDGSRERNAAAAAVLDAEAELDRVRRLVVQEVVEAFVEAETAESAVAVAKSRVEAAAHAARVQQSLYEIGVADVVTLTRAQDALVAAADDLVGARIRRVSSRFRLRYAAATES